MRPTNGMPFVLADLSSGVMIVGAARANTFSNPRLVSSEISFDARCFVHERTVLNGYPCLSSQLVCFFVIVSFEFIAKPCHERCVMTLFMRAHERACTQTSDGPG